jgi:hypothetical protein
MVLYLILDSINPHLLIPSTSIDSINPHLLIPSIRSYCRIQRSDGTVFYRVEFRRSDVTVFYPVEIGDPMLLFFIQ